MIQFILNGRQVQSSSAPHLRLLDMLRREFELIGAKEGCGEGECGACTVLMDGQAVHSCLVLAGQVDGHEILTIEGLAAHGELELIQQCFIDQQAIQCGYCTPGMIMSAKALLLRNPHPNPAEIREAMAGNICRCSGYTGIVAAVSQAAQKLSERGEPKP